MCRRDYAIFRQRPSFRHLRACRPCKERRQYGSGACVAPYRTRPARWPDQRGPTSRCRLSSAEKFRPEPCEKRSAAKSHRAERLACNCVGNVVATKPGTARHRARPSRRSTSASIDQCKPARPLHNFCRPCLGRYGLRRLGRAFLAPAHDVGAERCAHFGIHTFSSGVSTRLELR
jgi:hypothetical protein